MDRGSRARALLLLLAAAIAFVAGLTEMRGFDGYHHLSFGREIVRSGFSDEDPFLYPLAGRKVSVPTHWLGSLVIYLHQWVFGDPGPVLYAGFVGALLFAVLAARSIPISAPLLSWLAASVPLLLALSVFRLRASARPELLGVLFLALTLLWLERLERDVRWPIWAIPLLILLWGNVHPSVVFGLGAVALAALVCFAAAASGDRLSERLYGRTSARHARLLVGVAAMGAAATLVSPSQPVLSALRFARSMLGLQEPTAAGPAGEALVQVQHVVTELAPLTWQDWSRPISLLLVLAGISFLLAGMRRGSGFELALILAFAVMTIAARRFEIFAAAVAAPIAARNLSYASESLAARARANAVVVGVWVVTGAAVVGAALGIVRQQGVYFGVGQAEGLYPVRAAAYLESRTSARIFNTFQLGGYLEWTLDRPVFQDGRGWLLERDRNAALFGPGFYESFAELDRRYRFDALVVGHSPVSEPAMSNLVRRSGGGDLGADRSVWALETFDDGGMLYVRRPEAPGESRPEESFSLLFPAFRYAPEARYLAPVRPVLRLRQLRRSVEQSPECKLCRLQLADELLVGGDEGAAVEALAGVETRQREARVRLSIIKARIAVAQGDLETARRRLRRAAALTPFPTPVRREMAIVELEAGRADRALELLERNLEEGVEVKDLLLSARAASMAGDNRRAEDLTRRAAGSEAFQEARRAFERSMNAWSSGSLEIAERALRDSLRWNIQSAPTHSNLGFLYEDLGQAAAALFEQRQAIAVDPRYAAAYFGAGRVLFNQGDRERAAEFFSDYLELESEGRWAAQARSYLN